MSSENTESTPKNTTMGIIHFLPYPTSEYFMCNESAIGRRNTRVQTNPANTTCARCNEELHLSEVEAEMERKAGL